MPSPLRSRHCRTCNKCVREFDHHCPWLNTCIGCHNYKPFFCLLVSSLILLTLRANSALYVLVHSFDTGVGIPSHLDKCGVYCARIVVGVEMTVCLVCCYALGTLLALHVVLRLQDLTTYEFILMQRELNALREAHESIHPPGKYACFASQRCAIVDVVQRCGWMSNSPTCVNVSITKSNQCPTKAIPREQTTKLESRTIAVSYQRATQCWHGGSKTC